jgi:RimJ/RimL family protein N-acetyltransferase
MLCLRRGVVLVPLSLEHAERMCAWMHDPEVRDGVGLRAEPSPEYTRDWIRLALADAGTRGFAILAEGRHVGNVVLDRRDTHLETARLSVYVGEPESRGRGVGTTAIFRAAQAAFDEWCLHKLWLTVHEENERALAVYDRLGFVREGRLRDEFLLGGRRLAAVYMGLLRADFARIRATAVGVAP